jgi:glyoxylate reductase
MPSRDIWVEARRRLRHVLRRPCLSGVRMRVSVSTSCRAAPNRTGHASSNRRCTVIIVASASPTDTKPGAPGALGASGAAGAAGAPGAAGASGAARAARAVRSSILLTRRIPSSVIARLEAECVVDLYSGHAAIPRRDLIARVEGKHAVMCLLTDRIDRDVLDAARDLKIVANIAVGYNNIDVAACRERGIVVTNTPDVLTNACADFTWALILGITRRLGEGERELRRGDWKGWALDHLLGMELRGKQLGIVGVGRIGRAVAEKAPAFGMAVAYTARNPVDLPNAQYLPLDRLLRSSDVVSLHCPLHQDTHHLIDRKALAKMKRSAYLINTSRGPVVDEAALAWALQERLIAGAALDVYEEEPKVHPDLLGLENVMLIPHLASATVDTRTAMADLAASNVLAVLSGRAPVTPV